MSQQISNRNSNSNHPDLNARNSKAFPEKEEGDEKIAASVPVEEDVTGEKQSFSERWKTNRFWVVRATYHIFYSVWIVVMAIGGLIAWLIALLFI